MGHRLVEQLMKATLMDCQSLTVVIHANIFGLLLVVVVKDLLNNSHCFSITIMAFAIYIIRTWAWPKRVAMQLQQRKTKVLAINIAAGVLHAAHH